MPAIPLNILITPLTTKGSVESGDWTAETAQEAVREASRIWSSADIQFLVKETTVDKALDVAEETRTHDQRLLDILTYRRPAAGLVNVFLIHSIAALKAGGASYLDSDPEPACFVQKYDNAAADGRALAHELGHLLSLDHLKVNYSNETKAAEEIKNLMVEGLRMGTTLSAGQIRAAKNSKLAKKFSS